jgi:anthranilate phosphoribosyltransferase
MKLSAVYLKLLQGQALRLNEAQQVFALLFKQKLSEAQAKALLLLLAHKGEEPEEMLGCLKALRALEPVISNKKREILDTCGTGGDRSHSLNISTLAAIVIAGAGGKVAKHGNRSITSRCGSSDLMEALGVNLSAKPQKMLRAVESGLGYFHAPFYHPVFSRVQPLRRKLGVKTVFNLLGPLTNPVRLSAQLIGISSPENFDLYAEVLRRLRYPERVLLCRSLDGMDELTTSADSEIAWIEKGKVRRSLFKIKSLGFKPAVKKDFAGGDVRTNQKLALRILTGKLKGPLRDIVILNAGAGLWILKKARNLKEGIRLAGNAVDSGKAFQALQRLKKAAA